MSDFSSSNINLARRVGQEIPGDASLLENSTIELETGKKRRKHFRLFAKIKLARDVSNLPSYSNRNPSKINIIN
jgi:hypothetical protein